MKLSHSFLLALCISGISALECRTPDPSPEYLSATQEIARDKIISLKRQTDPIIVVDVYFHIASTVAHKDMISDQQAADQFKVLQDSYAPYGIQFSLKNTSRVVDDLIGTGFYKADGTQGELFTPWLEYTKAYRQGDYSALNVYFYSDMVSGISGICPLPSVVTPGDEFFYRDGCQINANSMPINSTIKGHTTVHEVGHWFGLLHTFQGGCSESGDGASDTPAEGTATSGCPVGKDSCPNLPGLDPIHNYMDYSDDTCTTEFTPEQAARMQRYWYGWRVPS
ncbi:zincin [Melanomma pulvis-pyrius CBS 109.77]|uniref:Zincin n=1 Tax=Melanomma pulvis-pyrius CBS 109.77 TaxID=1314802 RepID=A0A6A6WVE1_9PLEO|nr:zincin [Melanomma pulvis-pyrius CBS 109.77]